MLSRALSLATVTLLIGCFTAGAGACAGDQPRGRQEPFPDFRGHLQCLPQEPARPAEDRAGVVAAGLPAPALHHQQRHGLGAGLLPGFQRRDRHALSGQGSAKDQRSSRPRTPSRRRKPDGKPDQLDRFGRRQHPAHRAGGGEAGRRGTAGRRKDRGRDGEAAARPGEAPDAATDGRLGRPGSKLGKRGKPGATAAKPEQAPKPDEAAKAEPPSMRPPRKMPSEIEGCVEGSRPRAKPPRSMPPKLRATSPMPSASPTARTTPKAAKADGRGQDRRPPRSMRRRRPAAASRRRCGPIRFRRSRRRLPAAAHARRRRARACRELLGQPRRRRQHRRRRR